MCVSVHVYIRVYVSVSLSACVQACWHVHECVFVCRSRHVHMKLENVKHLVQDVS